MNCSKNCSEDKLCSPSSHVNHKFFKFLFVFLQSGGFQLIPTTLVCGIDVHARLLILRKKIPPARPYFGLHVCRLMFFKNFPTCTFILPYTSIWHTRVVYNVVDKICPLVWIGLNDLLKTGGGADDPLPPSGSDGPGAGLAKAQTDPPCCSRWLLSTIKFVDF